MTNYVSNVPEPEQQKKEDTVNQVQSAQVPVPSSGDESEDDQEPNPMEGSMEGYQPLSQMENEELAAESPDSSDEDMDSDIREGERLEGERREISIDTNLVLSTMKGVSIPGSSIPSWAKKLSDSEWDNIIQKTISGETAAPIGTSEQTRTSSLPPSDSSKSTET